MLKKKKKKKKKKISFYSKRKMCKLHGCVFMNNFPPENIQLQWIWRQHLLALHRLETLVHYDDALRDIA